MPDLHPTQGNISTLETSPPVSTSAIYRKQPSAFKQLGYARSYSSNDRGDALFASQKPDYYKLAALDAARTKESIIIQGLELITSTVVSRIGSYSHPIPQITEFVKANIKNKIERWIKQALESALWSGFSVQEINWVQKIGPNGMPQTWIDDLIQYYPLQVTLVANDYGIVKDGDTVTGKTYKSGVWVPLPANKIPNPNSTKADTVGGLVRLNKSKRVYITFKGDGNTIYGRSLVDPCLPWYLYKQAFLHLYLSSLERYATPLIYVKVPPQDTKEFVTEPDGTVRLKTLQEKTTEVLRDIDSETALVFTQLSKDNPVEIGALTTGNNFADSFNNAIELCDDNMRAAMAIPNLIMKDKLSGLSSGGASERQLDQFNNIITEIFRNVVLPFVEQAILQLIQYNFDARLIPEALDSGTIFIKPARASDLKVVLDGINNLIEKLNLLTENQKNAVLEMLGLPLD